MGIPIAIGVLLLPDTYTNIHIYQPIYLSIYLSTEKDDFISTCPISVQHCKDHSSFLTFQFVTPFADNKKPTLIILKIFIYLLKSIPRTRLTSSGSWMNSPWLQQVALLPAWVPMLLHPTYSFWTDLFRKGRGVRGYAREDREEREGRERKGRGRETLPLLLYEILLIRKFLYALLDQPMFC